MKVGYARVSTFEQDLDLQLDALNKEGCDRVFCDKGESGAKASRPEWDNCLDHLRKGDTLVIWKLDRASRSTKHLIELADDLKKRGVELKSLKEQIDTADSNGQVLLSNDGLNCRTRARHHPRTYTRRISGSES